MQIVSSEKTLVSTLQYVTLHTVYATEKNKKFRTVYTGTEFLQLPRALAECGTV